MKKTVMLLSFTAILIAAILISGQIIKNTMIKVTAVKAVASTAEDTVTCTGKVETMDGSNVYAPDSGVAEKIYVKEGDKVKAGQPIMDISYAASSYSYSSSSSSITSYNNAYDAYAAYLGRTQSSSLSSSSSPSSTSSDYSDNSRKISTVKAPISGIVESIAATTAGTYINSNKPAATIQNENGVQVRLSVDESQIADLKAGQKVQVTGVGFKNSVYSGLIESISTEAKQLVSTTGQETVVEAIASVKNPGADIKPGFTAKVKVITSHNNNVMILPYEAVREDSNGNEFVYRIIGNRAKKTLVTTGREFDSGFEIKNGIKVNDLIIDNPDDVNENAIVIPTSVKSAGETQ